MTRIVGRRLPSAVLYLRSEFGRLGCLLFIPKGFPAAVLGQALMLAKLAGADCLIRSTLPCT